MLGADFECLSEAPSSCQSYLGKSLLSAGLGLHEFSEHYLATGRL